MKEATQYSRWVPLMLGAGLVSGTVALNAQDAAPKGWKTTARLGATVTRGNSDTLTISGGLNSEKKWDKNEILLGAGVTYGENDSTVTASSVAGFVQYNRLFTQRLYGYARVDALHDDVADLAYRVTFSPGVGYYFVKNNKFTLSGEVGPGYVLEKFQGQDQQDYLTLRVGEKFTWQISKTSRLWQSLDFFPQIDDWGNYLLVGEIGLATKVTEHLDVNLIAQDNYRSEPAPGRTENDFKFIAGLGYTF